MPQTESRVHNVVGGDQNSLRRILKLSSTDGVSNTVVLIDNDTLKVVPCALTNDGTALKPSIQFDPRIKLNVGLNLKVDATFVQENPQPGPDFLSAHIITEALVSSVTVL